MSIISPNSNVNDAFTESATGDPIRRACEILEDVATNRGLTYRCLSRLFSRPDEELLNLLQSGDLVQTITRTTNWLGNDQISLLQVLEQVRETPRVSLSSLKNDYNLLFEHGVERISPRESSYRWKNFGTVTRSEADLRLILNVQYNSLGVSCENGVEDHIAVELEFLAFLCEQEAQRWSMGSTEAGKNLRSQQKSFVDDHIACWIPEFCYNVRKKNHPVYGPAAVFCDQWLNLDHGPAYRTLIEIQ